MNKYVKYGLIIYAIGAAYYLYSVLSNSDELNAAGTSTGAGVIGALAWPIVIPIGYFAS